MRLLFQTAFQDEYSAVARGILSCLSDNDRHQSKKERWPSLVARTVTVEGIQCELMQTGIGPRSARRELNRYLDHHPPPDVVVSIGLGGALVSDLAVGTRCIIDQVQAGSDIQLADKPEPSATWQAAKREPAWLPASLNVLGPVQLSLPLPRTVPASLVSVNQVVLTGRAKQRLGQVAGAQVCDMETHAIATVCQRRGIAWLGARLISDTVSESMPAWVTRLPGLVARRKWWWVGRLVATHPQDSPILLRLALRMQRLKPQLSQLTSDLLTHVIAARRESTTER